MAHKKERSTETDPLFFRLGQKLKKAIFDYSLIEDGDQILIALSGGKDSLALTELIGLQMRIFKPRFKALAAHISMSNISYESDTSYLKEHCEKFDIPFIHRTTSFNAETDHRKSPCFLCSWYRRKALFDIAKETGCNKIALGHHQDDILQTLLMNMTYQGSFGTMPPRLDMNKFEMSLIRPLCLIAEKELQSLANLQKYEKLVKNCPYEKVSNRSGMKDILSQLEEMNPQVRGNMWNSMSHIQPEYLPTKKNDSVFPKNLMPENNDL